MSKDTSQPAPKPDFQPIEPEQPDDIAELLGRFKMQPEYADFEGRVSVRVFVDDLPLVAIGDSLFKALERMLLILKTASIPKRKSG